MDHRVGDDVSEANFLVDFELPAPAIVITGPTAGGKSRLVAELASRFGSGVISLDSMKVYRGMDIGSAKPSPERIESTPFHLIDVRDPWEPFSVGDYLDELEGIAGPESAPSIAESAPWLFGGGTAFYLNTLLRGIFRGPAPDESLRIELTARAEREGVDALHRELAALDPPSAEKIHPTDLRRIVRALEVMRHCDEPFSVLQARRRPILRPQQTRLVGIGRSREELYRRIDDRVTAMFDRGWVAEVQDLLDAHDPPWSHQAEQSIGYAQIREALEAGEDPTERIPVIQQRTRHFARHQLIWFRKMPIEWWAPDELDALVNSVVSSWGDLQKTGEFPTVDPARLVNDHL
ncbi:MAG: tRNA (adenosine(37)-N6)-dimethylallyltransferase MiaA [Planctomycetota bacterium]